MSDGKSKIITRTVLLVSMVSLFTDVASEMLYPVMPIYLKSVGFSILLIGILEGLAEATAGLSKGYFGKLSDAKGKRVPFVQWGYALSAISKPMMAVFVFPIWIFMARTMDRLGKGIRNGARDAILSDETTPENKGRVFGFHRSMDTLGASIGPVLALLFLFFFPEQYRWLFVLAVIPGIIAVLLTSLLKEKKATISKPAVKVGFFSFLSYWKKSPATYKRLLIGLLAFTIFNSSDAFLLLMLKNMGFSDVVMIGFYIFYNLVYAIFSYPVGIVADKIGLKRVMIMGLILFSIVYTSMGIVSNIWLIAVLFFVYGIYASATEGVSKALITNISHKEDTATAIGFYSGFSSIFAMLASTLGGFIWFLFGPKYMFVFSGMGAALVVLYFVIISKHKKLNHDIRKS